MGKFFSFIKCSIYSIKRYNQSHNYFYNHFPCFKLKRKVTKQIKWKYRITNSNGTSAEYYPEGIHMQYSTKSQAEIVLPTIIFTIFWNFLMFYQIFFSPQVKRFAIISYKHGGIYKLPHEFPNNLRKLRNIRKVSKLHRMIAQCPVPLPKSKFCQY